MEELGKEEGAGQGRADTVQIMEATDEIQGSGEVWEDGVMAMQMEEEEQRRVDEDEQSREIEQEIFRLKAKLERLKGKKTATIEKDNSYSVNQELMGDEGGSRREFEAGNKTIGEILKIMEARVQEEEDKGVETWKEEMVRNDQNIQIIEEVKGFNKGPQLTSSNGNKERQVKRYKAKPSNLYIVELPEDSNDDKVEEKDEQLVEANQQQGLELELYMENALNLKRKWQDHEQLQVEELNANEDAEKGGAEVVKKRRGSKTDGMAEEAGQIMPHPKP
ncbi:hypothetical protein PIB30_077116 [Stylosanthes scabra]|uniref:Uncharacterized protein n=1 Tax=Stylosanthes scabra TaxID=79078 RepID=A0ABU6VQS2_9FABA|nr:hypothetical protein [Stylosanthes scabra]